MPVLSRDDAAEVESRVARVFAAASPYGTTPSAVECQFYEYAF